jgi:hypothetical protein
MVERETELADAVEHEPGVLNGGIGRGDFATTVEVQAAMSPPFVATVTDGRR